MLRAFWDITRRNEVIRGKLSYENKNSSVTLGDTVSGISTTFHDGQRRIYPLLYLRQNFGLIDSTMGISLAELNVAHSISGMAFVLSHVPTG